MDSAGEDDIWADDAPARDSTSGTQVAQQEWEKLSLRYSDVGHAGLAELS